MELSAFMKEVGPKLEEAVLAPVQDQETRLKASMYYSLSNGGKRLRPFLLLATLKSLGGDWSDGLAGACAVEYVHTYSLIHDDLPAMDNDDYRRGQLTNHKKFDEATAILAGDALLTLAFERLTQDDCPLAYQADLVRALASAAGYQGMVEGQMQDIAAEQQTLSLAEMQDLDGHKTGALFRFSVYAGALLAGAGGEVRDRLDDFACHFGLGYQIQNDLQEVVWTDEQRGKRDKSDQVLEKNTYPALLGTDGALEALDQEREAAGQALETVTDLRPGFDAGLLAGFLDYLKM